MLLPRGRGILLFLLSDICLCITLRRYHRVWPRLYEVEGQKCAILFVTFVFVCQHVEEEAAARMHG
jgi:hypothetical protein